MRSVNDAVPTMQNLSSPRRVAVVGAGISGLRAAQVLRQHGFEITVVDKSRGPGGRAATRRADPGLSFDHGAQYFTARQSSFAAQVATWLECGLVAEWQGRIVEIVGGEVRPKTNQPPRYVGVPGMTAIARHLAAELPLRLEMRIVELKRVAGCWKLVDVAGHELGPFEQLIVSLPAPQTAELLADHPLAAEARAVAMSPCWAVLVAFETPLEVSWDGAFVHDSALAWVARNSSKPGRDAARDCWVLHATPEWSATNRESARDWVASTLLAELAYRSGRPLPPTLYLDAHRWLYSAPVPSLDRLALFDPATGLAVCGDWLAGGRMEGAWLSGQAAAACLLGEPGL